MIPRGLYREGRYREALEGARARQDLKALALAALALGEDQEAKMALAAWAGSDQSDNEEAERLALQGFLQARRGDLQAYRSFALKGAQIAQTPLTLYHLGLSLPPKQGLLALEEGFRLLWNEPEEEARLAFALARTLRKLGRFYEALSYAALAELKDPSPFYRLEFLCLELLAGERPIDAVVCEVKPLLSHQAKGVRLYATSLLAQAYLMTGEAPRAAELYQDLLPTLSSSSLPYLAAEGVMAFTGAMQKQQSMRLAHAASSAEKHSSLHRGLGLLALGLARYPDRRSVHPLREAVRLLKAELLPEALRARGHLATLLGESLEEPYRSVAAGLRIEAVSLFLPEGLPRDPYLRALGEEGLLNTNGPFSLRPRGLELLVLLLAKPEGWRGKELAEALYGKLQCNGLKVELHRLREAGLTILSRPYRLASPMTADFIQLQTALQEGDLQKALSLYRGPLLPWSEAPGVEELRQGLEEELRQAVLQSSDPSLLHALAERLPDDLEVWEALLEILPSHDSLLPAVVVRVQRLKIEYGVERDPS